MSINDYITRERQLDQAKKTELGREDFGTLMNREGYHSGKKINSRKTSQDQSRIQKKLLSQPVRDSNYKEEFFGFSNNVYQMIQGDYARGNNSS